MVLAGSSCCIPLAWGLSSPSAILAWHHFTHCSEWKLSHLVLLDTPCKIFLLLPGLPHAGLGHIFWIWAACWVCLRVLGNGLWWVEARSASEVVAVALGGSSGLAQKASPDWGILCAACSSAAATQPHWPCNYHASCQTGVSLLIQGNFNWATFAHCEQMPVSQALVMLAGTRECSVFTCMLSMGLQECFPINDYIYAFAILKCRKCLFLCITHHWSNPGSCFSLAPVSISSSHSRSFAYEMNGIWPTAGLANRALWKQGLIPGPQTWGAC